MLPYPMNEAVQMSAKDWAWVGGTVATIMLVFVAGMFFAVESLSERYKPLLPCYEFQMTTLDYKEKDGWCWIKTRDGYVDERTFRRYYQGR